MDVYFVVRYFKEDFYAKADVLYPAQKYIFSLFLSFFLFPFLFSHFCLSLF